MSFQNCTIAGTGIAPSSYHAPQEAKRGDRAHIVSSSALRSFGHCPSRWVSGYESPDSAATEWGDMFDCALLTPEQFNERFAVAPATYSKEVMECPQCKSQTDSAKCAKCKCDRVKVKVEKEWSNQSATCGEWTDAQEKAGKRVITSAQLTELRAALARFQRDDILTPFVGESARQVHVKGEWKDAATGIVIPLQCLIDIVPHHESEFARCMGDLKTTRSAKPRIWRKFSSQMGYHVQAAFDIDLYNACPGVRQRDTWCFALSENYPPYETGREMLSVEKLETGRTIYRSLLAWYAECLYYGNWPGYDDHEEAVQGWSIDDVMPWDEAEAIRVYSRAAEVEAPLPF